MGIVEKNVSNRGVSEDVLQAAKKYPESFDSDIGTIYCTSLEVLTTDCDKPYMRYTPSFTNVPSCELQLTNSRYEDFKLANMVLNKTESGCSRANFTLHHCYNPSMGCSHEYIMQEVPRSVHRQTIPHFGAYAQGRLRDYRTIYDEAILLSEFCPLSDKADAAIDFSEQFKMLSEKTGVNFPKSMVNFYNKMGEVGKPSREMIVEFTSSSKEKIQVDIGWIYPLDFENENGIYKVMQENLPTPGEKSSNNYFGDYVPFLESSGGDIFYAVAGEDPDIFEFENVILYSHEHHAWEFVADDAAALIEEMWFKK